MMPLGMVEIGESGVIGKITGQDEVRQHLAELGFVMGERVTVVSKMGGNPHHGHGTDPRDGSPCAQGCAAGRSDGADRARL